jgi:hypothetical protein
MRESRTYGSVRAKAEWLSYSTTPDPGAGFRRYSYYFCRKGSLYPVRFPAMIVRRDRERNTMPSAITRHGRPRQPKPN